MDAAILTKCIAPIGALGSGGTRPAASRDGRAPSWKPPRAWGTVQSVQEDMPPRVTAEPFGKAVDARRE
eukprot:6022236-Pleurochrysis_carterae.AAC.1